MSGDAFADLYREAVLRHGRAPAGVGTLAPPALQADAYNPACGDRIALTLQLQAGAIVALRHRTDACLLCTASASLLAERALGLDAAAVAALSAALGALTQGAQPDPGLGALAVLRGVAPYPARRRCVMLPWDALQRAFEKDAGTLSEPVHAEPVALR